MQNQTITCPQCSAQFELSETLAHPYIEAIKDEYEAKLLAAGAAVSKANQDLAKEKASIEAQKADLDTLISKGVAAKRVELEVSIRGQIEAESNSETQALNARIAGLLSDLQAAKQEQLGLEQAKQDLVLKANSVDLEIAKGVNAKMDELKGQAVVEAEETFKFEIAELKKKLSDTANKLDEAKKKTEQGSNLLRGEVLELDFEDRLSKEFPWDKVEEVKKGQRGADCLQLVMNGLTQKAGTIIWETKRTQNWGNDWIAKLKSDARDAKAEISVIVSDVLPNGIDTFGVIDGVWVVKPVYAISLAYALRDCVLKTREARTAAEGKETKAGIIYDYVTGADFRARLEGIAEPFKQMQADLMSERRLAEQRFSKRQKQIDRVLVACFGMVGDLHGIAGQDIAELESIELKALGNLPEDDSQVD